MLESDGVDVLIEYKSKRYDKAEDVETLGTDVVRKDLHRIHNDEWQERHADDDR